MWRREIPHAIGIAIGTALGAVIAAGFAGAVIAVTVIEQRKAARQRRQDKTALAPYEREFQQ